MNAIPDPAARLTRRHFFSRASTGLGAAALAHLLEPGTARADRPAGQPGGVLPGFHFPPSTKRIIYLAHCCQTQCARASG